MKNKTLKLTVIAGILLFGAAQAALAAGNSASYAVSCTIPAIPGVNAPPYVSQTSSNAGAANMHSAITDAQNSQASQSEKQTAPKMIQENSGSTMVQTLYAR